MKNTINTGYLSQGITQESIYTNPDIRESSFWEHLEDVSFAAKQE